MNMSVEKKKYPTSALPQNWSTRDEQQHLPRKNQPQLPSSGKVDVFYYSRGVRNDASLVPPIRQTASIFKQPVTIYKILDGKVKEIKHGNQEKPKQEGANRIESKYNSKEKPKQLFWEKRLEGLRACDPDGYELSGMDLPKITKPVGPYIRDETVLQSIATALHVSTQPVTGQTGSKTALEKNPGVFLNPEQPLVQAVTITDDDIKRQEERVIAARKKLQEVIRATYASI
ncbi:methyl-CpG-binding domain protein 3 isoform X1 [Copidosoma floridanum]|uniref:methyl-CpG-binding domain protein 3 isoform X1 n=1 Tax=Copidosoma floridanum TaxID=29053 RepID=UPI0006C9C10A|nr:methyl-CpG-binding domain protein 3 isoform X1 [Copidosoma floridanum]